jgi:UTP:GlnB (protein PII) uridylyltransferase
MKPSPKQLAQFVESMGPEYTNSYPAAVIDAHARIVFRREGVVELGVFERQPKLTGLLIVGTDRAGFLSLVSEALVLCGIDVVDAEAFTRDTPDGKEAVDMFWLRRLDGNAEHALTDLDVERVRTALVALLDGSLPSGARPPTSSLPSARGGTNTRVRFLEDSSGALATLEIETENRAGLLLAVSRALFAQQVQVIRSEVHTIGDRVVDRFKVAELDGSPVAPERRLEIQVAVLSAAEPAKRLSAPSSAP